MKVSRVFGWLLALGLTFYAAGAYAAAKPGHAAARGKAKSAQTGKSHAAASSAAQIRSKARTKGGQTQARPAKGSKSARASRPAARRTSFGRRGRFAEQFTASSFARGDIFAEDRAAGEDPVVRKAAIDALGDMNGTAVVIDASTGRILAMVNQKLALSPGAEPCSTIKLTVAMAALSEGVVTRETPVQLGRRFQMNMTEALAHSNNLYFEELGRRLGFERVHAYANQFGLGELAGYRIRGEHLGVYPDAAIPAAQGGVGRMCSFGQGIQLTPLQLGAFVAALANGGTLYYLQHPENPEEAAALEPKVKRRLNIARYIPELETGMAGAVEYGTARRLRANFHELPVFGKTGTCSDKGTRFGWFASYTETPHGKIATVFFLEGGRPTFGPRAAELTGEFYRNLWERNYFGDKPSDIVRHGRAATGGVEAE